MAGILDALAAMLSGQGGGVLAGLQPDTFNDRWNGMGDTPPASFNDRYGFAPLPPPAQDIPPAPQPNAAFPGAAPVSTMNIGGYQMPQFGAASDYAPQAALPANARPTQAQMPAPAPAPDATGPFGFAPHRISDALASLSRGGTLTGAIRGQYDDPQSQQAQVQNVTAKALLAKGAPAEDVIAAMKNPDVLKALVGQYYGKDKWKLQKVGTDGLGAETYAWVNETNGTSKPFIPGGRSPNDTSRLMNAQDSASPNETYISQSDGFPENIGAAGDRFMAGQRVAAASSPLGNLDKTGEEYLATVPAQNANIIRQMVEGKIAPPSSFALAKPYWQGMLAGARAYDPDFDATKWASRHKLATEMGASAPNSMGGILSNGKSAFEHLKTYSGKLADVGNYSGPDIPGGAAIADVGNFVGNRLLPRAETLDKIAGANAAGLKYGEESTKFYTGTGGAAVERQAALTNNDARSTTAAAQAGFLQTEKELMLGRLREKESQIRDTMGETYLKQHPVFTPQLQATVDAIDANIAKLRGQAPPTAAAPAVDRAAIETEMRRRGLLR